MLYKVSRSICYILFNVLFRVKVYGRENIPETGSVILCSNHISNLDPPLVGSFIKRHVSFMAKEELFQVPILKHLIRNFGAFPIKRGGPDRQALVTTLKILREGKVLGIFPEGTRSKDGELGEAHTGIGTFALRTGAAVVPVAIIGPYRLFRPLILVYGTPRTFTDEGTGNQAEATRVTFEIMAEVKSLIEQYKKN